MRDMKNIGIVRRIDELGRLTIPVEMRRALQIAPGDEVEIAAQDDAIVARKYQPGCAFCDSEDAPIELFGRHICEDCARCITAALREV